MMMRSLVLSALMFLSACGCVRDPGDSAGLDYFGGCWSYTKENKADQHLFPKDKL